MAKTIIRTAIDVGTTKVCTVVADVTDRSTIRVMGTGVVHSQGLHKGMVVSINEVKDSIRESVRIAEMSSGHKIDSAYVGVSGNHIGSLNNHRMVTISRNDRLVCRDDLKKVLESAQNIDVSSDKQLLHVIPRSYSLDGQAGMKNPVGMYGARLDLETHIITAAVTSVKNLVKCIRGAKVDVDGLVFSSLASSEAVLTEHEKELGVILADIGGGTTDIAIYKDGSVCHTAVLPVGGYQLTRDISISLGLPTAVAEVAKRKYASVDEDFSTEQKDPVSLSIENGYNIMHQDLYEVVRARMEEILKLIVMEMPRSEYTNMVPTGLVLTGGTANLPGLAAMAQEMLQIPVRVGSPREIHGLADSLYAPAYASGVGLLMWGVKNDEDIIKLNGRKSLLSRLLFKLRRPARPDKKKPYDEGLAKGGNHDTNNS